MTCVFCCKSLLTTQETSKRVCLTCQVKDGSVQYMPDPFYIGVSFSKFEIERIKFIISQADKGTVVYLGKGDSEILKKLLEVVDKSE